MTTEELARGLIDAAVYADRKRGKLLMQAAARLRELEACWAHDADRGQRLREALERYGRHEDGSRGEQTCERLMDDITPCTIADLVANGESEFVPPPIKKCTCGLDAALKEAGK